MEFDLEIIRTFVPLGIFGVLLIVFKPSIITGDKASIVRLVLGGLFSSILYSDCEWSNVRSI